MSSFSYRQASVKAILQHIWHSPTFTTWGSLSVNILRMLVLLPFTLNRLSTEENSIWLLFMSMLALGNLADLGFSPTFTRMIALALGGITSFQDLEKPQKSTLGGSPNWVLIEKIYGTYGVTNLLVTFLAVLVMATLGTWAVFTPISKLPNTTIYWQAWAVLCLTIGVIFFSKKNENIVMGMGKVALVNRWNIVFGVFSIALSVTVLALGGNILHLFLALFLSSLASATRNYYLVTNIAEKRFKQFRAYYLDRELFKIAFSPSWKIASAMFFSVGLNEYTNVLYAQFANTTALASYQFAFRIMAQLTEFSKAPFYSKIPEFTRLAGAGEQETLIYRSEKSMQLALLFFVMGVIGVGLFADVGLWFIQSKVQFIDLHLWALMAWVAFWERYQAMHSQLYMVQTLNAHFYKQIILAGCLNALFMFLFINHLGMWTFAVSLGLSNILIGNWYFVRMSLRILPYNKRTYLVKSLAVPFSVFVLGTIALLFFEHYKYALGAFLKIVFY
jgi:O-antigen/teichoic acid export membrane protein